MSEQKRNVKGAIEFLKNYIDQSHGESTYTIVKEYSK